MWRGADEDISNPRTRYEYPPKDRVTRTNWRDYYLPDVNSVPNKTCCSSLNLGVKVVDDWLILPSQTRRQQRGTVHAASCCSSHI